MRTLLIWVIATVLFIGVNFAGAQVYKKVIGPVAFTGQILAPNGTCSAPAYGFAGTAGLGLANTSGDIDFCRAATLEWRLRGGDFVPGSNAVNAFGSPGLRTTVVYTVEINASGVTGTGKAVCVKADGNFGTCDDAVGAGGTCTCS